MTQQLQFREVALKNAQNVERLGAFQPNEFRERYGGYCLYHYEGDIGCAIGIALDANALKDVKGTSLDTVPVVELLNAGIIEVDDKEMISIIQAIHDYKMIGSDQPLINALIRASATFWGSLPPRALELVKSTKNPLELTAAKYTEIMRAIAEHPGDT